MGERSLAALVLFTAGALPVLVVASRVRLDRVRQWLSRRRRAGDHRPT